MRGAIALTEDLNGVSICRNDENYQSEAQVDAKVAVVVDNAPAEFNTLKKLSDGLGVTRTDLTALQQVVSGLPVGTGTEVTVAQIDNQIDAKLSTFEGGLSVSEVNTQIDNKLATYQGGLSAADVDAKIAVVVGNAPTNSNTLKKLSDRLTGDESNITAISTILSQKADQATTLAGYGIVDANPIGLTTYNAISVDPFYSKVELLLHFDTTNGGLLYDDSPSRRTLVNLNPTLQTVADTATKLIGSSSFQTQGGLSYSSSTSPIRTIGDFSIEFASNFVGNLNNGPSIYIFTNSIGNNAWKMSIYVEVSTGKMCVNINNVVYSCVAPVTFSTWEQWAIVKNGTTLSFFRAGARVGNPLPVPLYNTALYLVNNHVCTIASDPADSRNNMVGWLDEFRVTSASRYFVSYAPTTNVSPTIQSTSVGSIQYNRGGSLAGNGSFVYDETNNRFGIGTSAPAETIHTGSGNWRMDGVGSGLIYPDGTKQTTAPINPNWAASTGLSAILNKPFIPTNTSQLTNDAQYQTAAQVASTANAAAASALTSSNLRTDLTNEITIRSDAVIALATDIATEATTRGGDVAALEVTTANLQAQINAIPPSTIISNAVIPFTSANVSAGVLNLNHLLNYKYVGISIYNDQDILVQPDQVKLLDANNTRITLTSVLPVTGTWNAVVRGGTSVAPLGYGTGNMAAPYYGVAGAVAITEAFVLALTGRGASGSKALAHMYMTAGVAQFMYFAHPANYGVATFVDNNTGFIGAWEGLAVASAPQTVMVQGILYYVYRTDNANLGVSDWKAY